MSYQVVKHPVDDQLGAYDFVVSWLARPNDPIAKVRLYQDSCVKFFWLDKKRIELKIDGWFYSDEARGIHEALGMALKEAKKRMRRRQSQADIDDMESVRRLKHAVTLNRDETIKLMRSMRWRKAQRGGLEVEYDGKWLSLCRTDLIDNVGTTRCGTTFEQYRRSVAFGARITDDTFFVIDQLTDG